MPVITLKLVYSQGEPIDGPSRSQEISTEQLERLQSLKPSLEVLSVDPEMPFPHDEEGNIPSVWSL